MASGFNFFGALKSHIFRKRGLYLFRHFVFYSLNYRNYHHDFNPHVFVMFSFPGKTHALNFNYLSAGDIFMATQMIIMFKRYYDRGGSWYAFYHLGIKVMPMFYNIIRKCYRTYFSTLAYGYVVGNGIWKKSEFKRLYMSRNPFLNRCQLTLNQVFDLDDVEKKKKEKASQTPASQIEQNKADLRNLRSWRTGLRGSDSEGE